MSGQERLAERSRRRIEPAAWRPMAVIDVETAPPARVAARARAGSGRSSTIERPALHGLDAVSILECEMASDGRVRLAALNSMSLLQSSETTMLEEIVRVVRKMKTKNGVFITFNGSGHDLPFIRHRLLCNARYADAACIFEPDHLDVMIDWAGGGRYPRLTDLCLAVGLPVWEAGAEWGGLPEREGKSRLDVCATFVLATMLMASRGGWKQSVVREAWRAMSEAVLAGGVTDANLLALLRHPAIVRNT